MALFADLPALTALLAHVQQEIRQTQLLAARAANRELLVLYWRIGRLILYQQDQPGWDVNVIDQLAAALQREFPTLQGLSAHNLQYMRRFAQAYPDEEFVQAMLAQIPWDHHLTLLEKIQDGATRLRYVEATVRLGWSRDVLLHQIERGYNLRPEHAHTNLARTLPPADSELAQQLLTDPYLFNFLKVT